MIVYQSWFFSKSKKAVRQLEYHFNGNLNFRVGLKDGKYHGFSQSWWQKGRPKSEGDYHHGMQEGKWEFYNEKTGGLVSRGLFSQGKKKGKWMEFWPNKQVRASGTYDQGVKTGLWISWDSTGRLREKNSCFESSDTGSYVSYHANDSIHTQYDCEKGLPRGAYTVKSPEGRLLEEGSYDPGGKKKGTWKIWHSNASPASYNFFKDGLQHHRSRTWDSLGNLLSEGDFNLGTGRLKRYFPGGQLLASEEYQRGLKHGNHVTYYHSGAKKSHIVYNKGTAQTFKRWHNASGSGTPVLALTGMYKQGKRHGTWNWYSDKGRLVESAGYVDGKRHGPTRYFDSKNGKLYRTQMFKRGVETKAMLARP
ncbi:toxin-antitoxin system YwqK family antitoxin [Fibrobacterota bacterium]